MSYTQIVLRQLLTQESESSMQFWFISKGDVYEKSLLKKCTSLLLVAVTFFSITITPVGAANTEITKTQAQELITEADLQDTVQVSKVAGDLDYLSKEGFDSQTLDLALVDNDGNVFYTYQDTDGDTRNIVVTEDEMGLRSGFYHSIYVGSPNWRDYSGAKVFYNNSTMELVAGTISGSGLAAFITFSTGGYGALAGAAFFKQVMKDIAIGTFAGISATYATATSASFTDYRIAHNDNNSSLERLFLHEKTYTTNLGGSFTEYYYEEWTPI